MQNLSVMRVDDNVSFYSNEMTHSQDYENSFLIPATSSEIVDRVLCPYVDQSWTYCPSFGIHLNLRESISIGAGSAYKSYGTKVSPQEFKAEV